VNATEFRTVTPSEEPRRKALAIREQWRFVNA
jgi:hypothetical protein